ncbi:helix-turn-helix transcriptional regulator [Symbiopectobacterium sp. RP]|uniref:helix-turn-helix transcriptional regulator n=1 Tax=Symbiopectobacterium sp. RP TaxID=3248553 RepID=UPI003D26C2CD
MTPIISDTDLITIKEVERSVGLKKSCIYLHISNGKFPKQKKLGTRTVRWVRGEIEAWKKQFL